MKCPTCGGLGGITVEMVAALIGNAHWRSERNVGHRNNGLELVDKQTGFDFEYEHNAIHMVFKVLEDESFWMLNGSADSYGTQDWSFRPSKVSAKTKTVTVWE